MSYAADEYWWQQRYEDALYAKGGDSMGKHDAPGGSDSKDSKGGGKHEGGSKGSGTTGGGKGGTPATAPKSPGK